MTEEWLVGNICSCLPKTKLPRASDILKVFFYDYECSKDSQSSSMKIASQVIAIWRQAQIPTAEKRNVATKIITLFKRYKSVKKNKSRKSKTQKLLELSLKNDLRSLFDIAHKNEASLITVKYVSLFLEDQRGKRVCQIKSIHTSNQENDEIDESDKLSIKSAFNGDDEDFSNDYEMTTAKIITKASTQTVISKILNSKDVYAALDRINVSDRAFLILAAAIAKACEEDIIETPFSRRTIQPKRGVNRVNLVQNIFDDFSDEVKPPLVIHWDGKMLKETTSDDRKLNNVVNTKIDRLAILACGLKIEKILNIAKTENGTAALIAKTVFASVKKWDIEDSVVGLAFDTTATNTGVKCGASLLLQQEYFKKELLNFECRHHIYELVIGKIIDTLFGPSKSPSIEFFQDFKQEWPKIKDMTRFKGLPQIALNRPICANFRQDTIDFLTQILNSKSKTYTPRDDYKELMELCLLVLNHPIPNYKFKKLGACHRARWMCKVIYSFKMYLFRGPLKLGLAVENKLRDVCLFASLIYVKAWIKTPITEDSPVNDLLFYKQLHQYSRINKTISQVAIAKFKNHLWYLGSELVVLALFSKKITAEQKNAIVKKMLLIDNGWNNRSLRLTNFKDLEKKSIEYFIGPCSLSALKLLNRNIDFMLTEDAGKWHNLPEYEEVRAEVAGIKVVNDCAERALALTTKYNESLTTREDEMQRILQIVEDHRKRVPKLDKHTLQTYKTR